MNIIWKYYYYHLSYFTNISNWIGENRLTCFTLGYRQETLHWTYEFIQKIYKKSLLGKKESRKNAIVQTKIAKVFTCQDVPKFRALDGTPSVKWAVKVKSSPRLFKKCQPWRHAGGPYQKNPFFPSSVIIR